MLPHTMASVGVWRGLPTAAWRWRGKQRNLLLALANGSRPTYLPTAGAYGKGIYQESIAVLAPGSLEQLLEGVCKQLEALL